jgi:cytochrome P450
MSDGRPPVGPVLYDPRRAEVLADPYPVFRRLRVEDPVHWSEILGGWVLTRYEDVKAGLYDPRLSSDRITPFLEHHGRGRPEVQELGQLIGRWVVFTDPPTHTRLRQLMNTAFTSRAVERLRPKIQEVIDDLLGRIEEHGRMDAIRDFAYPLPVIVIAGMLGVPVHDRDRLKAWSDELALFVGSSLNASDKYERARRGVAEMTDYFRDLVTARRRQPRDDLISSLGAAEERGAVLSEDEMVATCVLLLFAGHETTTNLIGNGLLALLGHPDQLQALRHDPGLAPSAVEELLRYEGPTQAQTRVAREDIELNGRNIRQGDRVFLMLSAANRDPARFPEPDRLDLRRPDNHHVAFGHGIHFCIGAPLARLEGQIALTTIVRRLTDLTLLTDTPEWLDSLVFRGVRSLPVGFGSL